MNIEQLPAKKNLTELAYDLAWHLYTPQIETEVLIVAKRPFELLREVRKEWMKITRIVQRQRAKSLDAARIAEFSKQIGYMQTLVFTTKLTREAPIDARVFFIEPSQINESIPQYDTAYVTCVLHEAQRAILEARIIKDGMLILYSDIIN